MSDAVSIQNAFNEEYTHMRRSLAPRLLLSLSENMKYAVSMGFFEIGKIYSKNRYRKMDSSLLQNIAIQPLPERKIIAWVLTGGTLEHLRKTLESYIKNVLGYLPPVHTGTSLPLLHPGISGSYREEDISIVDFGMIHPEVATAFGLPQDTLYFEADFKTLEYHLSNKDLRFQPISRYQTLPRELNFMMPKHTPTGDIARMIDSLHPWIQNITVASVYEDAARIGIGKKSVNFAFILSNHDATISDDDALKVQNLIIDAMKKHGFELRGIES